MNTPAFKYPTCEVCKHVVDEMSVRCNRDDGSFEIAVFCHSELLVVNITSLDIGTANAIKFADVFGEKPCQTH